MSEKLRARGFTGGVPRILSFDRDEEEPLDDEEVLRLIKNKFTPERSADSPLSKEEKRAEKHREEQKQGRRSEDEEDEEDEKDEETVVVELTAKEMRKPTKPRYKHHPALENILGPSLGRGREAQECGIFISRSPSTSEAGKSPQDPVRRYPKARRATIWRDECSYTCLRL